MSQVLKHQEKSSEREHIRDGDQFLTENFAKSEKAIKESFVITQEKLDMSSKIDATFSGTTCVMCFLSNNNLVCANSGDSRAILCSLINGTWKCTQLSRDHKPEDADEAARVRRSNGRIEQSRL